MSEATEAKKAAEKVAIEADKAAAKVVADADKAATKVIKAKRKSYREKAQEAVQTEAGRRGFAIIDVRWLSAAFAVMLLVVVSIGATIVLVLSIAEKNQRIGECIIEQTLEHRVANQSYHDLFVGDIQTRDSQIEPPELQDAAPPTLEQIIAANRRLREKCRDLLPSEVLRPVTSTTEAPHP